MSGIAFTIGLFVLLVLTGFVWSLDRFSWRKQRKVLADAALAEWEAGQALQADESPIQVREKNRQKQYEIFMRGNWFTELCVSFFPVILFVFTLRSFIVEPFRIPSGSMIPTLQIGDMILVNKFAYGVRLPIIHTQILATGTPQKGDVMVFRYPKDPSEDYIKRVIGTPGDVIRYSNKKLTINNASIELKDAQWYTSTDPTQPGMMQSFEQKLGNAQFRVIHNPEVPANLNTFDTLSQSIAEACRSLDEGFECVVPPRHYFMMGDNRDNSQDSRYWGFVPEENIVGKAFFVWMNFSDLSRIGSIQ